MFYRNGWSALRQDGAVTARVSQQPQTTLHFPLPAVKPYEIVLRFDPVAPDVQQRVTVLFNRQLLGTLKLSWNPERMGSYRLSLPVAWTRAGDNEITLVPDTLVAAAAGGPRLRVARPGREARRARCGTCACSIDPAQRLPRPLSAVVMRWRSRAPASSTSRMNSAR